METFDEDKLRSVLSGMAFATLIADLAKRIGWSRTAMRTDLADIEPLYYGDPEQLVSTMSDMTGKGYARVIGIAAMAMYAISHVPTRLYLVQKSWTDLQARLSMLWSTAIESRPRPLVGGIVAQQIVERDFDPTDPSIALHSLHSALVATELSRLDTLKRGFESGMEIVHGKVLVDMSDVTQ